MFNTNIPSTILSDGRGVFAVNPIDSLAYGAFYHSL